MILASFQRGAQMVGKSKADADEARKAKAAKEEQSEELDEELEGSFPASDPPSMTQPATAPGEPVRKKKK